VIIIIIIIYETEVLQTVLLLNNFTTMKGDN